MRQDCEGVDRLLVETLHSDAMQIRVCVFRRWHNTPLPKPAKESA